MTYYEQNRNYIINYNKQRYYIRKMEDDEFIKERNEYYKLYYHNNKEKFHNRYLNYTKDKIKKRNRTKEEQTEYRKEYQQLYRQQEEFKEYIKQYYKEYNRLQRKRYKENKKNLKEQSKNINISIIRNPIIDFSES